MSNGTSTYWGSLGGAAGKTVLDRTAATAIASTGTALVTERTVYYGLPTINNSHAYTSSTTIYAPTGGGTAGQYLKAVGATSTPTWETFSASTVGLGNVSNNATLNNVTGAKGDVLYWSAANTPAHLTNTSSTTKQFLSITSQVPSWSTLSASDIPTITKSKISDFPTSMPASDVHAWAKEENKPEYKYDEINPIASKTFTGVIGTANDWANATFFFGSVKPDNFTDLWSITYKVTAVSAGTADSVATSIFTLNGYNDTYASYSAFNAIKNTSYRPCYYHVYYRLKSAGFTNGYGHALGLRLYSAWNCTTAANARTITIELLETKNCTFSFYDSMLKYAAIPGTGSTNYNTYTEFDFANNGLRETGDDNSLDNIITYFSGKTGSKGIWATSLFMEDGNGTYQNICTASDGTVTSSNRTTATTKIANTNGFKPNSNIYYTTTTYAANTNITGWGHVYSMMGNVFDSRYALNTTLTAGSLTTYKPVYLVGTINANDKLFYLDPVWWTQTPNVTGKVYILIGGCYDSTTSYCRINLYEDNPWYYYDGSKLVDVTAKLIETYGYTKNTGTVTSVQVSASTPLQSSNSTASSTTYSTTISFANQSPNLVLAGPTVPDASDAAPTFRALVAADIPSISKNKISDFPTTMTPSSHTHGNITNDGKISSDTTKASGQKFIFADSNGALIRSNVALGTGTGTYLRNDGTWGTPAGTYTLPTASSDTKGGIKVGTGLTMNGEVLNHSNSITAGTATGTAASTLTFGGTFKYPTVTYDAQGHITSTGSVTLTMPTLPEASTSAKGIVQLFNEDFTVGGTTGSTVTTQAVTPQALYHVWELANSKTSNTGTVTSVSAGNGLAGGPITTSGSLSVNFGTSATAVSSTASAGTAVTVSRSDHVHNIVVGTGDNNGQVKIAGQNASVKGLGTMAYESKDTYLPKSGGTITGNITIDDNVNPCPTIVNVPDPQNDGDAANKHYVDQIIAASDAMVFKGILQGSSTETPSSTDSYTTNGQTIYFGHTPSGDAGDTYKVSVGGFLLGLPVEVGDTIICLTDNTPASTSSNLTTVRDNWAIIQSNIDSSIYKGTNPFVQNHVVIVSSTNGEVKSASTNTTTIGSVTGAIELTAGTKPSLTMSVDANEVLSFSWSNGTFPALKNQLTQASVSVVTGFTADT